MDLDRLSDLATEVSERARTASYQQGRLRAAEQALAAAREASDNADRNLQVARFELVQFTEGNDE